MSNSIIRYHFENKETNIFDFYERSIPKGKVYPMHWHDFLEFELVVSGSLQHVYNNQTYYLEPGDAHIICYHDYHELTALTDVTLFCMHINDELLDRELLDYLSYNSFNCRFSKSELDSILRKMMNISKELTDQPVLYNLMIKNLVSEVLILLLRKAVQKEHLNMPYPIQKLITYINEHSSEDISLQNIAKEISFSASHLGRLLKQQTGYTFNEYLNIIRLKHACSLLRYTNIPVKEVAFQCGYNSVEYFSYAFKKKLLSTPSEYRDLVNNASFTIKHTSE